MKRSPHTSGRTCGYCGRPHDVSQHVAEESPFCRACLHERIANRARSHAPVVSREVAGGAVVVSSRRNEMLD